MLCNHDWEKLGYPIDTYIDYSGIRVYLIMCKCKKCRKRKVRKFY